MRRVILLVFACIATWVLRAQVVCSTVEYSHAVSNADPAVRLKMQAAESFLRSYTPEILSSGINNGATASLPIITIPIVFHILTKDGSQIVTDENIKQQLDVLNKAFRLSSTDTSKIPSYFQEFAADCRIQFVLARVDPHAHATSGIVRKSTWVTLFGLDDRIKSTDLGGDDAWDANKYLNVWVGSLAGGVVGYSSPLGGPADKDGVAIRTDAFGIGSGGIYNGGKTLVHEVGHWLGLRHIWGDAACGDDEVDDTPKQKTANRGCPSGIHLSCDNAPYGDMYNNYMDQVNDDCMLLFTKGQMNRMRSSFAVGGPRYALLFSDAFSGNPLPEPVEDPHVEKPGIQFVQLYPNPTQKTLNVQFSKDVDCIGKDLIIVNQFGQAIKRFHILSLNTTVDVSSLEGGLYFVKVEGMDRKFLHKFVKL